MKVSNYFVIRLLVFDFHFQYIHIETDFILLFKDEQNKDYGKRYREKSKMQ